MNTKRKRVMVIGGGIAGLTAAWELSKFNIDVDIIEKTGFLGGHAIQFSCKATDQCQLCGACAVEKTLKNVVDNSEIKVHLAAEIKSITQSGRFTVSFDKGPEYIDPKKCTHCGLCFEKCPVDGAIQRGYSKNNIPLYAICETICFTEKNNGCRICQELCPEGAIALDQTASAYDLDADAIILATGFKTFSPAEKPTYGYGKFKNVLTGLELDRIIRENGSAKRPSDGNPPQKIAFIQCVGSRDEQLGHLWCSQICCAYALRISKSMKYKNPDTDISIFYMDIQNAAKDFTPYYEGCQSDLRFIRTIPVDISPMEKDKLRLRYINDQNGLSVDEVFDLVVLSVGIMPAADNNRLSELLGINLNEDGFLLSINKLHSASTSKDGIFVAGTIEGPKSIAASMAHAGQAACKAMKYLGVIQ